MRPKHNRLGLANRDLRSRKKPNAMQGLQGIGAATAPVHAIGSAGRGGSYDFMWIGGDRRFTAYEGLGFRVYGLGFRV